MRWANFLHLYQPADQQPDILEAVVVQSYRPLLQHIQENKNVRLTLNVTGALLELFDKYGYRDLIEILREVGREGRVEFTGSAKYHALLPFLEESEIIRQIKINDETMRFFLEDAYMPVGFFPPEMAYKEALAPIVEKLGFKWIILDEIAFNGHAQGVDYTKLYKITGSNLHVFFRERRTSNLIMSAMVRSADSLRETMKADLTSDRYLITAMDGETFGHHRPGLEKMLFEIFSAPDFNFVTISDLLKHYAGTEVGVAPIQSTWASSPLDIERNVQFLSWHDPVNIIHGWQWELLYLALAEVHTLPQNTPGYNEIRKKLDVALASDHLWWASAKPWWSIEMIEDGAFRLLDTLRSIPGITSDKIASASNLYEHIVSTAFQWKRSGKIYQMMQEQDSRIRIPFKDRTVGQGGAEEGVYHAFMDMLSDVEKKAVTKREYEKAILWRDARYKLENKLDIYDTVAAIDLLRLEIPNVDVEKIIEQYKEKYRHLRGGQPEQRGA